MKPSIILILKCLLVVNLVFASISVKGQNCKGNGCAFISISGTTNGLTVHSSASQKIHVQIGWYFAGCNQNQFDINPGASLNFPFRTYCPPYTATLNGPGPTPPKNGTVTFINQGATGKTAHIFCVLAKPGQTVNFCSSQFWIANLQLSPGQKSQTYTIPQGLVVQWQAFDGGTCDGNQQIAYGSVYGPYCANGCQAIIK